jgi:methylase of polypeptide subunit release factors
MKKTLTGTSLAGGSVNYERVENDFYATDPQSVRDLLDIYDIEGETFYEPCVGNGSIAKVLRDYFPDSEVYGTDLIDRGYGDGQFDFLNEEWEDRQDLLVPKKVDWIITNPPYSIAKEFIDNSLVRVL